MSDGYDLAAALAPHHDAILSQLALAWRAHAPKSTVMLGSPQRAIEAADAIGTVWFDWLNNINDLAVIRELAARLVRQDLTYAIASSLAQALSAAVTQVTANDDQHAAVAVKLTRHFSAAFLDQVATQHELHTRQAQERLAVQLQASAEVGRAATSILDTDQLLREVVNLITDRFGFYYAAVFTLDHTGQYAVLREATGKAGEILKNLNHQLDIHSQSMVGAVITSQRPRIAAESEQDPLRFSNPLLPDTRSEIALPLVVGDQILGALDVQSTEPNAFDELSATVLQNMADQIAIALENARLFGHVQSSEARFRDVALASADIVWETDARGRYTYCSDRIVEITGFTPAEVIGKEPYEFIEPEDVARVQRIFLQARLERKPIVDLEVRSRTTDGRTVIMLTNGVPMLDAHGDVSGYRGVLEDITARKQTERSLAQAMDNLVQFKTMFDHTNVGMAIVTTDDRFMNVNQALCDLVGYSAAELQTMRFGELTHPDDVAASIASLRKSLAGELDAFKAEKRYLRKNGEVIWVDLSTTLLRDAQRQPLYFISQMQDIRQRKQNEEALAREQSLMNALMDSTPDHIYFKDLQSRFLRISKSQADTLGVGDPSNAVGKSDFDFFTEEHARPAYEDEQTIIRTGQPVSKEERETRADQPDTWVLTTKLPLYDETGNIVGTFGVSTDITERKQAEETLARERNLLRTLIDTLPERIFAKDTESRFTLANAAEIRLDGATSFEELRGKNDFDFYPIELAQQYYQSERPILVEGQSRIGYEERSVDQAGQTRWHISTKVPLRDADGHILGLVGMTRDITTMKEAEAERERLLAEQQKRAVQLQASAEVGRVATSILNPDQLLGEIVELLATRFGFYHVAAFTVDDSGRWAILREATGEVGQQLKDRGQALAIRGQSLVGNAIRQRQPRMALDVGAEAVQFNDPLLPDTRSEIALPLFVGDRVLGALDVHSTLPAAFDENFAILLQSMADQIAVALNTAEQVQREQTHVRQTNRLMQIVIDLSERTDRAGLQNRLVRSALVLLDTDRAQFWFKDASGLELKAAQSVRPGADQSLAISQELADRVCRTGLPLRLDSPPVQAGYASRITDVPFNAALITPISWQGHITGVLSVMRSQPGRPFTQDDENSAQLLAAQAAAALETITLAEQQQHRAVQLQTAAEVSRASSTILQLEELLTTVVELVRDNFSLYYVGTFLLDEQANWAYLRAGTGEAGRKMLHAGHRLRVDETSMIGWSIVHRQARIALDVGTDATRFDNPLLPNTRSEMALPLISRGRIIGAATIQSTQPAAFTPDDMTILQTMADQITTAVENARLFEQTQQSVQQMTALNEIVRAVSQEIELERVLESAYQSVQHLLPVDTFIVALYDQATDSVAYPLMYDEGQSHTAPASPIKPDSRIGRVIRTAEPILENVSQEEWSATLTAVSSAPGHAAKPAASRLYVPLQRGNQTIGALSVQTYQFDAYTRQHVELLKNVANQLSVAIVNARLFEQTRQAVDELNALNRRLTGEAWQSYVQTRSPEAVIWHANDPTLHQVGREQAEQLAAGEIAVQHFDGEAEISVPIALRGQLIGALRFRAPADKWDASTQAIVSQVAGHLAQAAENTRLIEQTQRAAQREKAIAGAADKIHRSTELETVLHTAINEINRITGLSGVSVQLGFGQRTTTAGHDPQPGKAGGE